MHSISQHPRFVLVVSSLPVTQSSFETRMKIEELVL